MAALDQSFLNRIARMQEDAHKALSDLGEKYRKAESKITVLKIALFAAINANNAPCPICKAPNPGPHAPDCMGDAALNFSEGES